MNSEDFTLLIEQHRHEFYTYIYRQLWDKSQCDDVFSQAMMTAWEKIDSFQEGSNFRAWVYQIMTYKCLSTNKAKHKYSQVSLEDLREQLL